MYSVNDESLRNVYDTTDTLYDVLELLLLISFAVKLRRCDAKEGCFLLGWSILIRNADNFKVPVKMIST